MQLEMSKAKLLLVISMMEGAAFTWCFVLGVETECRKLELIELEFGELTRRESGTSA
jgi:hypothetical protein